MPPIQKIRSLFKKAFFIEIWTVGVFDGDISALIKQGNTAGVNWIKNTSPFSFLADPFVLSANNNIRILAEYFNYLKPKGRIVEVAYPDSGAVIEKISLPFHMSYPFIFEYEGEKYLMPETYEARQLMLYKMDNGSGWNFEKVMIDDFAAVDSTLLQYDSKWWLFCTNNDNSDNENLYIWYADNPLGEWQQHKNNPVKSDISSSRPAGKFFETDGKLYRPAQDSSRTYGGAVSINRVVKLSEDEYEEVEEAVINPDKNGKYPDGVHTVCPAVDKVVVDGKVIKFSLLGPLFVMLSKYFSRKRKIGY